MIHIYIYIQIVSTKEPLYILLDLCTNEAVPPGGQSMLQPAVLQLLQELQVKAHQKQGAMGFHGMPWGFFATTHGD